MNRNYYMERSIERLETSMEMASLNEIVENAVAEDSRYAPEAFFFVCDSLDFTAKKLKEGQDGAARHVNGRELAEGFCGLALEEFGPMASFIVGYWGIKRTEDIGEIVFKLIDAGRLSKTEGDTIEDFAGLFDLHTFLSAPYSSGTG
jgi:uncharacterized repeat protein (TIGR04138 family)